MQDYKEPFSKNGYVKVDNLLEKAIADMAGQYCLFSSINDFTPESAQNGQVPESHAVYADCLTETILLYAKPRIEHVTGLKLLPTYSYYRIYEPGQKLDPHTDRPSCEISASITLKFIYDKSNDYKWPLKLKDRDGEEKEIVLDVGEGLVYRGMEIEHWRDVLEANKDSVHVQLFLHYVDANGPYTKFENDKRPAIGLKPAAVERLKDIL